MLRSDASPAHHRGTGGGPEAGGEDSHSPGGRAEHERAPPVISDELDDAGRWRRSSKRGSAGSGRASGR